MGTAMVLLRLPLPLILLLLCVVKDGSVFGSTNPAATAHSPSCGSTLAVTHLAPVASAPHPSSRMTSDLTCDVTLGRAVVVGRPGMEMSWVVNGVDLIANAEFIALRAKDHGFGRFLYGSNVGHRDGAPHRGGNMIQYLKTFLLHYFPQGN
jgi:hypothetical protein